MTRWVPIKEFENLYKVSESGEILSLEKIWTVSGTRTMKRKQKIIKPVIDKDGYLYVNLWKHRKSKHIHIHRLVANAFIPNPENKPQVNHIDGDKKNNYVGNLEWCTVSENIRHAHKILHRRPSKTRKVRCIETQIIFPTITNAAQYAGVSVGTLHSAASLRHQLRRGKVYVTTTAGGYHWEFV